MNSLAGTRSPLIFVFLGNLPEYAFPALKLNSVFTNNPLILLGDHLPKGLPDTVEFYNIQDFYDGEKFTEFSRKSNLPAEFRNGFWLKAAERLFVLEAFARKTKTPSMFHGELDCLFFDLPSLEEQLVNTGKRGLFLPRETPNRAVASLLYVNDLEPLTELADFMIQSASLGNEMNILGALPYDNHSAYFALPSAEFLFRTKSSPTLHEVWPVVPNDPDFIVDGVVLGQWIFGLDPRNMKGAGSTNQIQNHKSGAQFEHDLRKLKFTVNVRPKFELFTSFEGEQPLRIHCLHVHSKVHKSLSPEKIQSLVRRLNAGKKTRLTPPTLEYGLYPLFRIVREFSIWFKNRRDFRSLLSRIFRRDLWVTLFSRSHGK